MSAPVPILQEKGGRFFARWSRDDAVMRSLRRSILEIPDATDSVDDAFLAALRSDDAEVHWKSRDDLLDLGRRLAAWRLGGELDPAVRARIAFRLKEPPPTRGKAAPGAWRLELAAAPDSEDEWRAIGEACRVWPPLCGMADDSLELEQSDLEAFLRTGAKALRDAGYRVEIPDQLEAEISADVVISPDGGASADDGEAARMLRTKVTIRVAGEPVTREEIEFLLDQGSTTVFFRGRWIEVDRGILKNALKVLEADGGKMSEHDAMLFAFRFRRMSGLATARVKGEGWFGKALERMRSGGRLSPLAAPKGFKGKLRAYQRRGYSWLKHLTDRGFGALLADDMGLGKTVQTIAWILKRREGADTGRALIVAPVSVTMNWIRELRRFAPKLKVMLHQGKRRLAGDEFLVEAADCDVVVTGYALFVKDFRLLSLAGFGALVLDEAQMIKNPDTRVARSAFAFPCQDRVALTGTPFENRVTDLWSIEEFLNSGLLGSRGEFVKSYGAMSGGATPAQLTELRNSLAPFLLRRLKTEPRIAAELGPKREVREYCVLSARQRAAYEVALARYASSPDRGRAGKGAALALLTELKLVCDGFGGDGTLYGGKADRLVELLESIFYAGESALVFTQYAKVGERIRRLLAERFSMPIPYLHGGLSQSAREAQIAAFNESASPTAFVLSLKAGGFGLNLTKATHVIHYDRWWNPAVENQATDRAHRIGQARTVFVHLFISPGTLEDRIDTLLEEKRALAGELIASGESFLLKLSAEEFARTVRLEA